MGREKVSVTEFQCSRCGKRVKADYDDDAVMLFITIECPYCHEPNRVPTPPPEPDDAA